MAFDRAKTLRAAEKFLELGKIPAAIKEYCKIVADDPDDFTTLNMLGDLQVRVGDKEVAISSFARIAEHFHKQDFALKAIAMYKKIDRLRPHDPEIAYTSQTPTRERTRRRRPWRSCAKSPTSMYKIRTFESSSPMHTLRKE